MKKNLFLLFALIIATHVSAQQAIFTGKVTSVLGDPIAFTSVYIKGSTQGTSANTNGIYQLKLNPGKHQLVFRAIGYSQLVEGIEVSGNGDVHTTQLQKEDYQLKQTNSGEEPA